MKLPPPPYHAFLENARFKTGQSSGDRIRADLAELAFGAGVAEENAIVFLHDLVDDEAFGGEETGFEVAAVIALGAEAGTGEIGAAEVGGLTIDDDRLHVHARAEEAFEAVRAEFGIFVEIPPEPWSRLLGMDQTHFHTLGHKFGEHG